MKDIPKYEDNIPISDKIKRLVWRLVSLCLFRPFTLPQFNFWRIRLLKLFGAEIGSGSIIYASAYIPSPWNLKVGKETALGPGVKLHIGKTILGDKVTISQRTYLCSATHATDSVNMPFEAGVIEVKDFAWVAAEAFVMTNTVIGEGAVVGGRAAVFRDVPDWTIVGGNPAKIIKKREVYDDPRI